MLHVGYGIQEIGIMDHVTTSVTVTTQVRFIGSTLTIFILPCFLHVTALYMYDAG